jgi:hypothetical protein
LNEVEIPVAFDVNDDSADVQLLDQAVDDSPPDTDGDTRPCAVTG